MLLFLYACSNGFGKIKILVQLNRLQKVIDRSTLDGDDGLPVSIVDSSSCDDDGIFAAN